MKWLDMEDAPKDANPVLLSIKGDERCALGYWCRSNRCWNIIHSNAYHLHVEQDEVDGWSPLPLARKEGSDE